MTSRARIISRPVAAILLAVSLTACGSEVAEGPTPTTSHAVETSEQATPGAELNAPGQLPEETVESFFAAADAAAADGWQDLAYNDAFLTPELAERSHADDERNAATGAVITGERELTEWTTLDETETSAVVEFCMDTSDQHATKDGEPIEITGGTGESVGRFTLVRSEDDTRWLISEKGFLPEDTTCAEYFSRYDD